MKLSVYGYGRHRLYGCRFLLLAIRAVYNEAIVREYPAIHVDKNARVHLQALYAAEHPGRFRTTLGTPWHTQAGAQAQRRTSGNASAHAMASSMVAHKAP